VLCEVAELNRHLLLLQIKEIENELLPCEEKLQIALEAIRQGHDVPDRHLLRQATEKFARLRCLQSRLRQTENLLAGFPGRRSSTEEQPVRRIFDGIAAMPAMSC
jgi:hypothetical protein